ncbi:hypothetical protein GJ744_000595 [Endocarpon pusillum]|uniref:Uncharacterized protein n=1 Tax=Endocarpon pusillum TaxID=364733 RepID=A0A8H7E1U5_9EURO|nr:hypothetical protein GJ744_000595 [Endocarpon pusillum]
MIVDFVVMPPILPIIQDTISGLRAKSRIVRRLATRLDRIVALQGKVNRQPHDDGQDEDDQDSGLGSCALCRVGEQEDEDDYATR